MSDIFIGFPSRLCSGIKRDATHTVGVFAIAVIKSFTSKLVRGARPGPEFENRSRNINRATLPRPALLLTVVIPSF